MSFRQGVVRTTLFIGFSVFTMTVFAQQGGEVQPIPPQISPQVQQMSQPMPPGSLQTPQQDNEPQDMIDPKTGQPYPQPQDMAAPMNGVNGGNGASPFDAQNLPGAQGVQGSQLGANIKIQKIPNVTIGDEILYDYTKAKNFSEFIYKTSLRVLPGDDLFLYKKFLKAPDLKKIRVLPNMVYINDVFTIYAGKSEISINLADRDKFEFEINKEKVILSPTEIPSRRWTKINDILVKNKVARISFLPVAFAQEHGEPTLTNMLVFGITSRLVYGLTADNTLTENPAVKLYQVWSKARETKSVCAPFFPELNKKLAALQVEGFRCEDRQIKKNLEPRPNGNIIFEIPMLGTQNVVYKFNRKTLKLEEKSPDMPGKTMYYKRSFSPDPILKFMENSSTATSDEKKKVKSLREKGIRWVPIGTSEERFIERGEQLRDFVDYIYSTDFCLRCGIFIKKSIKEIAEEMQVRPIVTPPKAKASPDVGSGPSPVQK